MDQPDVYSIVVIYNPDLSVVANVTRIAKQSSATLIFNNGCNSETLSALASIPKVTIHNSATNVGIAKALNTGFRLAKTADFSWIATFDQDTTIPENYFDILFAALKSSQYEKIGILAHGYGGGPVTYPLTAITSGSVIKMETYDDVQGFCEDMFIDYVDYDFCLKANDKGWRLLQVNSCVLDHKLGKLEHKNILGLEFTITSHSALRRYTITRNRFICYKRYAVRHLGWALKDICWFAMETARITLLEKDKLNKWKSIVRGLFDGLKY